MKSQNITNVGRPRSRWYDDACGTAHALELLGERWALLIVRELMFGGRRFGALRASLPGVSANVLTQRLEGLEAAGVVVRRRLPPPASVAVYELTPWGYEAEPIFQTLGRWAARSPDHDPSLPLSAASLMLSFRTMFSAARATGMAARVGFRIGEDGYRVRIGDGALSAERAEPADADVVFTGAPTGVAAVVYGGLPLDQAEAAGLLAVEGDHALAERFATLFPLPAKVEPVRPPGAGGSGGPPG